MNGIPVAFNTVESMTEYPNPAVQYAAVSCVAVWYNIDKPFSKQLFLKLLERDTRVLGSVHIREEK